MNSEFYFLKGKINYFNFAKVIIARCSKDPHSVEWWQNKTERKTKELTLSSTSSNNLLTAPKRYELYKKYYAQVSKNVCSIQKILNQCFQTSKLFNKQQVLEKLKQNR